MFIAPPTSSTGRYPCLLGLASVWLLVLVLPSSAQAFTPIDCSQPLAIPIDVGTAHLERDNTDPNLYADNIDHRWRFVHNAKVAGLFLRQDDFDTESCCDHFYVDKHNTGWPTEGSMTSPMDLHGTYPDESWIGSLTNDEGLDLRWKTDSTIGRPAKPRFDTAIAICGRQETAKWVEMSGSRNRQLDGILLGDGDVVFVYVRQPAFTFLMISLDAITGGDVDFDLYAHTSSNISESNHTWSGTHRGSNIWGGGEFITISEDVTERPLYLAIHSHHGAGQFQLRTNVVSTPAFVKHSELTVCTQYPDVTTMAPFNNYRETLRQLSRRIHAMTAGGVHVRKFNHVQFAGTCEDVWCDNLNTDHCDVIMTPTIPDTNACGFQGRPWREQFRIPDINCTTRRAAYTDPEHASYILAHEAGHMLGLDDEYHSNGGSYCGHSIMNGPEYDWCSGPAGECLPGERPQWWTLGLCTEHNHCDDGRTNGSASECASGTSAWSQLEDLHSFWYYPPANQSTDAWASAHLNHWAKQSIQVVQ